MTEEGTIRKLDWKIDANSIQSVADEVIENSKKLLDDVAKTPKNEVTIATLQTFEEILAATTEKITPLTFLKYTSSDKAQRDAAHIVEQDAQKFFNEVMSRNDVYEVLVELEPIIDSFEPEDQTLLSKIMKEFRHRGAALEHDIRMEFLEIANNISVRESDFNKVLNEITTTVKFTMEELEGVPPEVYENLEKDGDAYLCTLDYPVYNPIIRYAKNQDTRAKIQQAYYLRGGKENTERLADTLALRDRQAKLVGHSNFAEYEISRKMAKTPERVFNFMNELKVKLKPLREKEFEALKKLKSDEQGLSLDEVEMELADLFYYHEVLMKEKYAVDQNDVKKYFPMDAVVKGVLEIYQKVLNLEFVKNDNPDTWHEDVTEYKVIDKISGNTMGVFYLDLYPRDGKFKHYAVFTILNRRIKDGNALLPITSMVANFQKPTDTKPSLLTHPEVETFFHEFGHLMHVVTNKAKYARFGLGGVLPDFIEVPSIMLENWVWKEEVLTLISGHYEDRTRKLPKDLLDRMLDAKLADTGILQLRQVFYSLIDMLYHTETPEDPTSEFHRLFKEITGFTVPDGTIPEASFGHLMGGYEAGYYSYLWSRVYAQDLFTKFEKNGFMDEKTGLEYREKILAPGGSRDPDEMVQEFLGRESNNEAFLKSLGIGKK
ncbi:MAG: M3 family metallopeptidase [Candidatus Thorarchaeota archaeon]|jgi:Zn-dependent oligopeptidase